MDANDKAEVDDPRLGYWPPVCVHGKWLTAFCYSCLCDVVPCKSDIVLILEELITKE